MEVEEKTENFVGSLEAEEKNAVEKEMEMEDVKTLEQKNETTAIMCTVPNSISTFAEFFQCPRPRQLAKNALL